MYCSLLRLLTALFFTLPIVTLHAQTNFQWHCADDQLSTLQRQLKPGYDKKEQQDNLKIREYIHLLQSRARPFFNGRITSDSAFTIPVVVHVIYPPGEAYGTGTNISYAQIRSQLEALNAAFSKTYPVYNGQSHPAYAVDTRIRFCLARTAASDTVSWAMGPGGREYGVRRYADGSGAYNHNITVASANQLLRITHPSANSFPFENYLNIWLVKSIGGNNIMGYAPRPIMSDYPLDGVVVRADIFGDNTAGGTHQLNFGLAQGKVLAHEIGHYLNLYHIFQGGCAGTNAAGSATDACDLNGDMICDTEPANTQNIFCTDAIPNTCNANYNAGTTTLDMINNYMSYADDDCMNAFTLNQAQRMWATLNLQRQTLWLPSNLAATGVLGRDGCVPPYLNAQILTKDAVFCAGKPITFSNPTSGNTATSYQWQLPGASISTASSNAVTVRYNTPGNYKVLLRVNDGTNNRMDSLLFTVIECKLDSSLLYMSHWYFGDYGSIDFSSGAPVQTTVALTNHSIQGESAYSGQLPFISGTVSLSDSLGNLLFYSNGVSVWNNNHKKMNTQPLFGTSDINASTGFCYIPYPGQPGKYFMAGVYPNFDESPSGVRFVMVDVGANSVQPYQEFQHPLLPNRFSEFLTVVPHCNGTDYWIITKGFGLGDTKFYSFVVTQDGIDGTQAPVVSSGFEHPGFGGSGNQLKANRQGNKLILISPHGSLYSETGAVYDFDNRTGLVKNEKKIPNVSGYNNIQGGGAFSPNGEYIYLMRSTDPFNGAPYWLFQYRASDLKYNVVNAPGFYFASAFQLGPDNQIYITTQDHFFARVSNPDKWGGVTVNGRFINMRQPNDRIRPGVSIPGFIDARQLQPTRPDFSATAINCNTYRFSSLCFDNYTATWNLGDGSPMQTGNTIQHSYTQTGEFNVTLTLSKGGMTYGSATKKINILPLSSSISGPDFVCTNGNHPSQYFSPLLSGADYKWFITNGSISGPDNFPFADVIWSSANNTGRVELQVTKDNCTLTASKSVSISKGPEFNWALKDSVCFYDSSLMLVASPAGGKFSGRGVINNTFFPSVAGLGNHTLTYTYLDETTCLGQIEKAIKVGLCNIPTDSNTDCEEFLKDIQIAPNPVNGILKLKSPYVLKFVQVYNSGGQKVAEGKLINNSLHLPVLATGIYTVLVYCEKNMSHKAFRFLQLN